MTSMYTDLLQHSALLITTITALLVLVLEAPRRGRPGLTSIVAIVGLLAAAAGAIVQMPFTGTTFGGMLAHGGFSDFFAALVSVGTALAIALGRGYLERMNWNRGESTILILFAAIGMILIASANDLIILFLGIELMSVCLYVLAGLLRVRDRSNEAGLKYFLLGAFSTGFLLYGIALVYGAVGSTNLGLVRAALPVVGGQALFLTGAGLILVGLSFKVAAVPFHMWAPDVYEGAPTPVSAFMSTAAKAAAFSGFLLVFIRTMSPASPAFQTAIAAIAAGSMIVGNLLAIAQTNVKRMLAYSSVAHAGYMLAGVAAGSANGETGVMFYISAYVMMNIGAFGVVSLVEKQEEGGLALDDYTGLSRKNPVVAALMALFMFALAGVPPFAGFFGKYYVFLAAVESHMTWLAIVGVLMSFVSAYYYLRIVVLMYFREGEASVATAPSKFAAIAVIIAAVLTLGFGVFPSIVIQAAQRAF